jgi:hypothetical protein
MFIPKQKAIDRLRRLSKPRHITFIILVDLFYGYELYEWYATGTVWFLGIHGLFRISFATNPLAFVFAISLSIFALILFLYSPLLLIYAAIRPDARPV